MSFFSALFSAVAPPVYCDTAENPDQQQPRSAVSQQNSDSGETKDKEDKEDVPKGAGAAESKEPAGGEGEEGEEKDEKEKKPIKKDRSESPQTKRKVGAAAKYGSGPEVHTDDSGDKYIELAANRRATVRAFKGKTYVDIRETYEQDGKTKPGKKGIMVSN